MGGSIVDPAVGHRSNPVLGVDLVFTLINGSCQIALQGPVTRRVTYPSREGAHYIGMRFRPGLGPLCSELAVAEICDDSVSVQRLAGLDLGRLGEQLLETPRLVDKGRLVWEELHGSALSERAPSCLVTAAIQRLRTGRSGERIERLAADLGVTERTLQRHFRSHLGISPKHAARLLRIERLIERLDQNGSAPGQSLAALASACGFFDQAHMTNDVTRVLGITPKMLARERRPTSMR